MTETVDAIFRDDVTVKLADSMGGEGSIVRRAKVSTEGSDSIEIPSDVLTGGNARLLRWLYLNGHGTPFEGVEFELYFEVPIFVSRQIVKHRLSSINEESGRYRELQGVFYVAPEGRPLVQVGKTGAYTFELGTPEQLASVQWVQKSNSQSAWDNYQKLLEIGIAKEVARMHLPVNLYSSMYFKANLRSILNFLSLRKDWGEDAVHASKAQYEIALVSDPLAEIIKVKLPNVWSAFVESGYQAV